jgi:hypothetical protein
MPTRAGFNNILACAVHWTMLLTILDLFSFLKYVFFFLFALVLLSLSSTYAALQFVGRSI